MASSDVIKELLVAIGYKNDEVGQKKLVDNISKISKDFLTFATAAEAAALAVVGSLAVMAKGFESAYYASSRTNSSVKEMKAFAFAASQMGSSVEEATSAVEGLALKIRENPGYQTLVQKMTGDKGTDWTKQLVELGAKYSTMSSAQAHAYAGVLGIPEHLLLALEKTSEFRKQMAGADQKYGILGFDPQEAANDGAALTRAFRSLYDTFDKIGEKVGSGLFKDLQPQIKKLDDFLLAHGKEISDMFVKIGDALFKMFDYVVRHLPQIDHFVESIGGWQVAMIGLSAVFTATFVARVASLLTSLTALSGLAMPAWLLGILGLTGYAAVKGGDAAKGLFDQGFNAVTPGENTPEMLENQNMSAWDRAKKIWRERPKALGGSGGGTKGSWWTPERQKAAYDRLTAGGMPGVSAIALISRWKNVESAGGPTSLNASSGAYGIIQGLGNRKSRSADVNDQLDDVLKEYRTGSGDGAYVKASVALRDAKSDSDAAIGASAYERAEGYLRNRDGTDNFTGATLKGMDEVRRNVMGAPKPVAAVPGQFHIPMPTMPGYAQSRYDALINPNATHSMFNPPPLGPSAMNDNSRAITMHNSPHITISGVSDPTQVAAQIGAKMDKSSSTLLRNMQSAIG